MRASKRIRGYPEKCAPGQSRLNAGKRVSSEPNQSDTEVCSLQSALKSRAVDLDQRPHRRSGHILSASQ